MAVIFEPRKFREIYEEFGLVSDVKLQYNFHLAEFFCSNGNNSLVSDLVEREHLLYLLVAHFCALDSRGAVVGHLSSANQGSVSASFVLEQNPGASWYNQSQYGATYWQMTLKYRAGRYYA